MYTRIVSTLLLAIFFSAVFAVEPVEADRSAAAIINGTTSASGGQPWIAALIRKTSATTITANQQFCGGTLIAPGWVLTAAHCVAGQDADSMQVVIGREALGSSAEGERLDVTQLIPHHFYRDGSLLADIALVRLKSNSSAQPLRRAEAADDELLTGTTVSIYGWGYRNYKNRYTCDVNFVDTVSNPDDFRCDTNVYSSGFKPQDMLEGRVKLFSYDDCDARYRTYLASRNLPADAPRYFSEELTPSVLCAWDPLDVNTPCHGDSGGPLVGTVNGTPVLLGVVSFGYVTECALAGQLAIYSRVAFFWEFIDGAMGMDLALGFETLCPARPEPEVSYAAQGDGKTRVTVSWQDDAQATGWRLFYAPVANAGNNINRVDLAAGTHEMSVMLQTGQSYHVAVLAHASVCDSPMSAMLTVTVP